MKQSFVARLDRANSSIELRNLSDRALRDIGLTRGNEGCYFIHVANLVSNPAKDSACGAPSSNPHYVPR
jgi:hypothetical protein